MVEVVGKRTALAAGKAAELLNDTNVQTSLIGALIGGASTFIVSGAATKDAIKDVFDDIVDMSLFTPVGNAINAVMPNAAIQGTMVATAMLSGLSIGERITDLVIKDDMFDETGHLKTDKRMLVAGIAAAISGACVYAAPKIADIVSGKKNLSASMPNIKLGDALNDADKVTKILLTAAAGYLGIGGAIAYYGRLAVADANGDGKCTQGEYEAWMNGLDGALGIFKPVVTMFKPIVSAVPGFELPSTDE